MKTPMTSTVIFILLILLPNVGVAEEKQIEKDPASETTKNTLNDDLNYTGDTISFPVKVTGTYLGTDNKVCIPAKTRLRGLGRLDPAKGLDVYAKPHFWEPEDGCEKDDGTHEKKVQNNVAIHLEGKIVNDRNPNRYGLTYGTLLVPYKYHFSGSKDFNGNATIGPYLGYRFDQNDIGLGIKLVGFLGAAPIPVTEVVNGENKKSTLLGFSYGLALLGEVKQAFQMGVVFGYDKVSDGTDYEDDGKLWGAVALGYKFSK